MHDGLSRDAERPHPSGQEADTTALQACNQKASLQEWGPMTAGLSIQATKNLKTLPIGSWPGLGVLAVWAAAALLAGGLLLRLRDA